MGEETPRAWRTYHTESTLYSAAERAIHHRSGSCRIGTRIAAEHKWVGTGLKPLCTLCADSGGTFSDDDGVIGL